MQYPSADQTKNPTFSLCFRTSQRFVIIVMIMTMTMIMIMIMIRIRIRIMITKKKKVEVLSVKTGTVKFSGEIREK